MKSFEKIACSCIQLNDFRNIPMDFTFVSKTFNKICSIVIPEIYFFAQDLQELHSTIKLSTKVNEHGCIYYTSIYTRFNFPRLWVHSN